MNVEVKLSFVTKMPQPNAIREIETQWSFTVQPPTRELGLEVVLAAKAHFEKGLKEAHAKALEYEEAGRV